jgi:hypothetical protein
LFDWLDVNLQLSLVFLNDILMNAYLLFHCLDTFTAILLFFLKLFHFAAVRKKLFRVSVLKIYIPAILILIHFANLWDVMLVLINLLAIALTLFQLFLKRVHLNISNKNNILLLKSLTT